MVKKIKNKTIKTIFGEIKNEAADKEEYFLELCRMEDTKILNALNALHSRLTEGKKQMALKWSVEYNVLLGERSHD
jgi:hypothetical protein|tara:strand:- start:38 stop:265 length:228 start_codon:yes stop_codon:yes gene_type:complete